MRLARDRFSSVACFSSLLRKSSEMRIVKLDLGLEFDLVGINIPLSLIETR